jgi:hypothetical protein
MPAKTNPHSKILPLCCLEKCDILIKGTDSTAIVFDQLLMCDGKKCILHPLTFTSTHLPTATYKRLSEQMEQFHKFLQLAITSGPY